MPVIGVLNGQSFDGEYGRLVAVFRQALSENGYVEGQNVAIEYRWAEGQYDRLPALAADLVQRRVAVIFAGGAIASAQVAKSKTATIPIVFANGGDPVEDDLIASFARPGGNVTGVSFYSNLLGQKRLGLLRQLIPAASLVGVLVNPSNARAKIDTKDVQEAAGEIGQQLIVVNASGERDFDAAFATLVQHRVSALLVNSDALFNQRGNLLVALAARHAIPAIYDQRGSVAVGGLMSYGTSITDAYHQAGVYVGRILKGTKPADLPVLQPTKFELVINLKTAKTLGLTIPPGVIAIADEVIE